MEIRNNPAASFDDLQANLDARHSGEECCQYIEVEVEKYADDEKLQRRVLRIVWQWLCEHPLAKKPEQPPEPDPKPERKPRQHRHRTLTPDAEEAVDLCEDTLAAIDDIPDEGHDFACSVAEKIEGIQATILRNGRVTDRQRDAIDNMAAGVERWL